MYRACAILFILSYLFAAIGASLGYALYVQYTTPSKFPCPCGCEGDEQKCTCHLASNTVAFTPCGMGTNNILLPDASLSIAIVTASRTHVEAPLQSSLLFWIPDQHPLLGVSRPVEHPPRLC